MLYSTSCCLFYTNFDDSAVVKTFDLIHKRYSFHYIRCLRIFSFIDFLVYQHKYAWRVFFAIHIDRKYGLYGRKLLFYFLYSFGLVWHSNDGPLFEAVFCAYRTPSHHIHELAHLGQKLYLLHFSSHLYLEIRNPLLIQHHWSLVQNLIDFFHIFLS